METGLEAAIKIVEIVEVWRYGDLYQPSAAAREVGSGSGTLLASSTAPASRGHSGGEGRPMFDHVTFQGGLDDPRGGQAVEDAGGAPPPPPPMPTFADMAFAKFMKQPQVNQASMVL